MKTAVGLLVGLLLLSGCGAAPSAPLAAKAPTAASKAQAFGDPKGEVAAHQGHLRLVLTHTRLLKEPEHFDTVCVLTPIGGMFSPVWLGLDGQLWVQTDNPLDPTEAPRYYAVGSYQTDRVQPGAVIRFTLNHEATLTYRKAVTGFPIGRPIPAAMDLAVGHAAYTKTPPALVRAN